MKKFIKTTLLLGAVMTLLSACREYSLYQYHAATLEVLGGDLVVALEGTYGKNLTLDGQDRATYGFPYSLKFMLSMPYERELKGLTVKDLVTIGEKSNRRIELPDIESFKVKDPRKRSDPSALAKTVIASLGNLTSKDLDYENYTVKATIIVHGNNNNQREEKIKLKLNTNFKKEKRSDWLDGKLSP
ncbi:MAG: hypothetical protein KUG79_10205 [Pseudomonadales bacterium]|nr:hypothetical protein [Pseudomonadales bacterium]